MSATPPDSPSVKPLGFDLGRIAIWVAIAIPIGMSYYWGQGPASAWAWGAGCAWMLTNLCCLDRAIRALLAPPDQVDYKTGAIFGVSALLVMPGLLLGLLAWSRDGGALEAIALGLTLPLVLMALRAIGALMVTKQA